MSMTGVSITSSKSMQLEATQDVYDKLITKLNLILINDKSQTAVIRPKLFEIMSERKELGKYSASELYVMQQDIKKQIRQM